jgi:hypothetical protein
MSYPSYRFGSGSPTAVRENRAGDGVDGAAAISPQLIAAAIGKGTPQLYALERGCNVVSARGGTEQPRRTGPEAAGDQRQTHRVMARSGS